MPPAAPPAGLMAAAAWPDVAAARVSATDSAGIAIAAGGGGAEEANADADDAVAEGTVPTATEVVATAEPPLCVDGCDISWAVAPAHTEPASTAAPAAGLGSLDAR
eukprot:scaffold1513_cov177-Isochrysis_galbana.AAC.7